MVLDGSIFQVKPIESVKLTHPVYAIQFETDRLSLSIQRLEIISKVPNVPTKERRISGRRIGGLTEAQYIHIILLYLILHQFPTI